MELTIAIEQRFFRTPNGEYWTESLYPHPFWSRYLAVFDGVKILARVHDAPAPVESWKRVDGDGVSFAAIPGYVGPWDFARRSRQVRAAISRAVADDSATLLRVPGLISMLAYSAMRQRRPYGVEVVGDPCEVFSSGVNSHPLRPFFRWWFSRGLKAQCKRAACNLYVTERTLQSRYPPGIRRSQVLLGGSGHDLAVGVSDVELPDLAFVADAALPRRLNVGVRFRVAFVGMLEVGYKGLDVLLTALANCVQAGLDAELTIIGSGRQMPAYRSLANSLGLSDRVMFLGSLASGDTVRKQLDASDLFVLPSRVEGLPRALVEAMARGLPCVGSRVGGVPELLPQHAMVTPGKPDELAARILEIAASPELSARLAAENLAAARRYHENILQPKRAAFYRSLRELTAAWQRGNAIQTFP